MTTPPRPIRFWHQGAVVEVAGPAALSPASPASPASAPRTVLNWLREDARCIGTKEGCAEGDCGACTVVVGELDAFGALTLKPVNACIQFLPTLDGKALFAVEDVATANSPHGATPHPAQNALVACHGSQCGFCTPGFVLSLWACYERHQAAGTVPTRQQLADDLSGNLCRCTGYRPILDAGQQMFVGPAVLLDRQPVRDALQALRADAPLSITGAFHAPRTLAAFAALRAAKPQARVLAGSTDIGLWLNKQFRELGELIYIGNVAELQTVVADASTLHIGAAATLEAAWAALATEWPSLREVGLRFASLPVRSVGTMGGNVANGSPIGDAAPVLIALGARIVLRRGDEGRSLALEDFYLAYMHNALQPGEFVQAIAVPRRSARPQQVRGYKISKRFDSDISAVCMGLSLELDGENISAVCIACGGLAGTVQRAWQTEAVLRGQPWSEATLQVAQAALARDFTPLSDMRASAAYRLQVAQNLLRRAWLETRATDPLPAHVTTVWAREETT